MAELTLLRVSQVLGGRRPSLRASARSPSLLAILVNLFHARSGQQPTSNGTTRTRSRPKTATSSSRSTKSRGTTSTSARACSSRGTRCASREVMLRSTFRCPERRRRRDSGRGESAHPLLRCKYSAHGADCASLRAVSGRSATSDVQATALQSVRHPFPTCVSASTGLTCRARADGLWPYTYDSCDVGTLPNQTCVLDNPAIKLQPKAHLVLVLQLAERYRPHRG